MSKKKEDGMARWLHHLRALLTGQDSKDSKATSAEASGRDGDAGLPFAASATSGTTERDSEAQRSASTASEQKNAFQGSATSSNPPVPQPRGLDTPDGREHPRSILLPGAINIRDLGGYQTASGLTQSHRFLRSGGTDELTRDDIDWLKAYGVSRVIDLRGDYELRSSPDPFASEEGVCWSHVPLYSFNMHDPKLMATVAGDDTINYMTQGYLNILGNHGIIRQLMKAIAQAQPDECVLFHCSAGMDRTGVTAMLLLGLVGASRQNIVANYCYSFADPAEVDRIVYGAGTGTDQHASTSSATSSAHAFRDTVPVLAETMGAVYDTVLSGYGSVRAYLKRCGMRDQELDAIIEHFVSPAK